MTNLSYMMGPMPSENPWLVQINLDLRNCYLRKVFWQIYDSIFFFKPIIELQEKIPGLCSDLLKIGFFFVGLAREN